MQTILDANGGLLAGYEWLLDRFISVAYFALINYKDVIPQPDALSDSCDWYDLDALPSLILDHSLIVEKALDTLRQNLDRKLVTTNLLPKLFTMIKISD